MTIDSFFTHGLAFAAGAAAAVMLIRWATDRLVDRLLAEIDQNQSQSTYNSIRMEIELVENQVMCYNADTKEFICQGQDLAEVLKKFKQRFPGTDGIVVAGNDPVHGAWIRKEMEKINETSPSV